MQSTLIKHQAYNQGLSTEVKVINYLKAHKSSSFDNKILDIDYYYQNKSVSLKTQNTALKTGNIALELTVTTVKGTVEDSWFKKGKAIIYHFLIGNALYSISKHQLETYIKLYGFDRIASLTKQTRQSQQAIGHYHIDSQVGLVNYKKLINLGILIQIGEING